MRVPCAICVQPEILSPDCLSITPHILMASGKVTHPLELPQRLSEGSYPLLYT